MHDIPNLQCTYIGLHSNFCNPPPKRSLDGFRRTYVWNTVVPREYMTRSHNNDYLVLSYKTVMRFPRRNRSPRASRRRYLFIYLLLFIYIYIFIFFLSNYLRRTTGSKSFSKRRRLSAADKPPERGEEIYGEKNATTIIIGLRSRNTTTTARRGCVTLFAAEKSACNDSN